MKQLLELITSLLLLLTAVCPAYCSGDCQEEIRKTSIRQYKNLSPLSVINSRKASLCSVCREAQHAERYRN